MPTSARWEAANLPEISVKTVHSAGLMWASTPTPECADACGFAENPYKIICNFLLQDLSDSASPSRLPFQGNIINLRRFNIS